jgi:conjugal transfer pilin signal peptidase TrbI
MTVETADIARRRFWNPSRKLLYRGLLAGIVLFGGYDGLAGWRDRHAFMINISPSLPNWAFLVTTGVAPRRGEYVFFNPPRTPLVINHFGVNPQPFGKIVYGVGGDVVTRDGPVFSVNGRVVATAKPLTKRGEPLVLGPTGTIPGGCYYVGSPHRDGFDSRYAAIGWICNKSVVGTGAPVL